MIFLTIAGAAPTLTIENTNKPTLRPFFSHVLNKIFLYTFENLKDELMHSSTIANQGALIV